MNSLKKEAYELIDALSGTKLKEAHNYLQYLNDIESETATKELLNLDILSEISEGIKQIQNGEFVKFNDVRKYV